MMDQYIFPQRLFVLIILIIFVVFNLPSRANDMGLVYDAKIGQYKDLSYDALSEKGLTWKARAQLFGGDTVHYESLTDRQRIEKQEELKELLLAIKIRETSNWADPGLADRVEAEILNWLDAQVADVPKKYAEADIYPLRAGAVVYFRAYEIFGDKKYLEAGLNRADVILKAQWPRGHWPWGTRLGENFVRIQDGFNNEPFWIMLYAYKLSGDKKYYESAKRCADVLLSLQRMNGGWPDQWSFNGKSSGHSGVMNGVSFNDNATNSCVQMMVAMFHMTGDKKYIARLALLGEFIEKSKMGQGDVTGWCEQYNDDGSPTRARQYEIELPYPRALTRGVGPLLVWLYLMDGNEGHMHLLKRAYAWHEYVRKEEIKPTVIEQWREMSRKWSPSHHSMTQNYLMEYRPGWPDAYLPDGSNWGRVLNFRLMLWNPVTSAQKKKYDRFIDHSWPPVEKLAVMAAANQPPPRDYNMYVHCHSSIGNSLSEIRRALLEHKRGGREGMLKYYSNPTKFTPDQYLQARVDAAKRALDLRNRRMAYPFKANPGYTGMSTTKGFNFLGSKSLWYGRVGTKWGAAFQNIYPSPSVSWHQWQFIYDMKLAHGEIDPASAARGGRGFETVASQTHLDSWDVLGEWGMATIEMDNHFDVPLNNN